MPGALAGIRVVDFGHYIAGPLAAVMLSDQGADVIHVDPPGGPRWKSDADAFLNRGKRRISLDLKQPDDLAIAQRLVDRADVLIENFRPGVMKRLGLDLASARQRNPRLITCSLPGFAADDPRASMRAWEGIVDAATGNCRARAGEAPPDWDTSLPTYSAIPLASNFAAFLAATSIAMALIARQQHGAGQHVEVPLFHAMFTAIGPAGAYVTAKGLHEPRPIDLNGSGTYRCGDGRYIQFDPSNHRFLTWFAQAAGISRWGPEYLDVERLRDPAANARLHERLAELFLTRPAQEWEALAYEAGAVLNVVRTAQEWLHHEHALAMGAVTKLVDPELGPTWMAGLPVLLMESPGAPGGPRHLPNADRAEIMADLERDDEGDEQVSGVTSPDRQARAGQVSGVTSPDRQTEGGQVSGVISPDRQSEPAPTTPGSVGAGSHARSRQDATLTCPPHHPVQLNDVPNPPALQTAPATDQPTPPAPLDGVRVLDLTQVLAGPTSGRLLAELGADVVKINGPQRRIGSHGYLNRGKRTVLLDVESTEGQQVFWKLVEQADVVIQNFPHGTAERYGIGYDQVRARKPEIVYASLSVHGHHGPWKHARGYERQGQAVTGVMDRVGDVPAILGPYNLVDIGTGVMTAFAVGLGLYRRLQTGKGQHVQTSLSQTATYHQTPYMLDYEGKMYDEPRGWTALGTGPLQRFYRAQDGWFFLGARESDEERVIEAVGVKTIGDLEGCFLGQPLATWVERLRAAGISAQAVVNLPDLMVDPWIREHGLSVSQTSEEVGEVTYPGPSIQMSETPVRLGPPVRQPGADGPAVLAEVGLADAVEKLDRQWVLQTTNLPRGW